MSLLAERREVELVLASRDAVFAMQALARAVRECWATNKGRRGEREWEGKGKGEQERERERKGKMARGKGRGIGYPVPQENETQNQSKAEGYVRREEICRKEVAWWGEEVRARGARKDE